MPLDSSHTRSMNDTPVPLKKPSLAERIGGENALKAAIAGLYDRILSDPDLAHFFHGIDMSSQERHQLRFFKVAFGHVPSTLNVPALILEKHARLFTMGLSEKHFDKVAAHLVSSLEELGVAQSLIDEAVAIVGPLRSVFEQGALHQLEGAK